MIILFTGNGKGKTTASLGQMVRVVGRGKSALMIQFIKGPWVSGEDAFSKAFNEERSALKDTEPKFEIRKMGLGFVGILGDKLPIERHKEAARKALDTFVEEKNSGKWHMIALDEVNVAVSLGLITAQEVVDAVKGYPEDRILILSGRGAVRELIDIADLATEMREIKHPFSNGKTAKPGIEF